MPNILNYFKIGFLSLLLTMVSCTDRPTDLELDNLKGCVTTVKVSKYKAVEKFGEIISSNRIERMEVTTYNEEGYKTSWKEYGRSGNEYERKLWTYNEDNIITEYKYFEFGDLKESVTYVVEDGKQLSYTKDSYELKYGVPFIKEHNQGTFYYESSNNRPTKEIIKIFSFKNDSQYDVFPDTVCIDTTIVNTIVPNVESLEEPLTLIQERHFTYNYTDNYGSKVVGFLDISDKDTFRIDTFYIEKYNKEYKPTEHLMSDYDVLFFLPITIKTEYNENGDVVSLKPQNYRYIYSEFDEKNNWTKRTVYDNDEVEFIEVREITYK